MVTTIKSSGLDFLSIKNNLKTFISEKSEFADYNFEASGLSNILDVLAWNTHYNGLIANFALNESFLSTAQLRASVISLASGVGYVPKSKAAARAQIKLSLNTGELAGRPANITLPIGTEFTTSVDDKSFTFQTTEVLTAADNGQGFYQFKTYGEEIEVTVYEGIRKTKSFLVGAESQDMVYVIPDTSMDSSTAVIKVYTNAASTVYSTYSNLANASVISENSTLYVLKEAPNEYYELTFGDGATLGLTPVAGNKVVVEYLSVAGPAANEARIFSAKNKITLQNRQFGLNVVTLASSIGGANKESVESIRKNAPFQYASQNRMVTAADYSALVLRNFSNLIKDIKAWGGEDNLTPTFGSVFMSIVFNNNVPAATMAATKRNIIDLAQQLSVITFDLRFADPVTTYIETNTYFQFNPKLTTISLNTVQERVQSTITKYFSSNIGKFEQSFRRSNMLSLVDDVDLAVLSSRSEIKMQQRITPLLDRLNDFTLRFPSAIQQPDDVNFIVTSNAFRYNGFTSIIRNKLNSTKLEVINLADFSVVVDNIGSYISSTGIVEIVGFRPSAILSGQNYIKISVVPANQSAVSPQRNEVLEFDLEPSFAAGVLTTSI
jgi:hypothetical protein